MKEGVFSVTLPALSFPGSKTLWRMEQTDVNDCFYSKATMNLLNFD